MSDSTMWVQDIKLTNSEINLLLDALVARERELQKCRRDFFGDWSIRRKCERQIDSCRHLSRVLDGCLPHD